MRDTPIHHPYIRQPLCNSNYDSKYNSQIMDKHRTRDDGSVPYAELAALVLVGWEFGVVEELCVTLLIGSSIDYCIHLAVAYSEAAGSQVHSFSLSALRFAALDLNLEAYN